MTFPYDDLPEPFESDEALRIVGRIAIESARLEVYLATMRGILDEHDDRDVAELVRCSHRDNARAIRRLVTDRQEWLPAKDGTSLDDLVVHWAETASLLLAERGDLLHSPWFNTAIEDVGVVMATHSRTGARRVVDVAELRDLGGRIDEACERFVPVYLYVFMHNQPRH